MESISLAFQETVSLKDTSPNDLIVKIHYYLCRYFDIHPFINFFFQVPEKAAIGLVFDNENVQLPKRTRAWLQITFKGELLSSLEGFYSNPYVDKNGCTK